VKKAGTANETEMTQPMRPVTVKFVREIDFASLRAYVHGQNGPPSLWTSSPEVKALNLAISNCFDHAKVFQHSANRFYITGTLQTLRPRFKAFKTGQCMSLNLMNGYFYTCKPAKGNILLNVSLATSAFYKNQTVHAFLQDENTFTSQAKRCEALIGVRVKITYARGKTQEEKDADWDYEPGRIKTIQGVGPSTIAQQTFKATPQSKERSVMDYLTKSMIFIPRVIVSH
jgi:hypothetical protein